MCGAFIAVLHHGSRPPLFTVALPVEGVFNSQNAKKRRFGRPTMLRIAGGTRGEIRREVPLRLERRIMRWVAPRVTDSDAMVLESRYFYPTKTPPVKEGFWWSEGTPSQRSADHERPVHWLGP